MAMSHICPSCAFDLGAIAPVPDPIYNLPLVQCPRCARYATRRPPRQCTPIREIRQAQSLALSLFLVALICTITPGLVVLIAETARHLDFTLSRLDIGLAAMLIDGKRPELAAAILDSWFERNWADVFGFFVLALIIGAFLRLALPHWRWPLAWLAFATLVALVSASDHIGTLLIAAFEPDVPLPTARDWGIDALVPFIYTAPAVIGWPVGILAQYIIRIARPAKARAHIRRVRARRSAS